LQKLGYIPASVTSNRHQLMSGTQRLYRDRIYIVKDIILKLVQYGELTATSLISFCGLNFKKHMSIVDKLESKGLTSKNLRLVGKKPITAYKPTRKGIEFCSHILEPYEIMFPRTDSRILKYNQAFLIILI
jgi:predicted transcriptional regulator